MKKENDNSKSLRKLVIFDEHIDINSRLKFNHTRKKSIELCDKILEGGFANVNQINEEIEALSKIKIDGDALKKMIFLQLKFIKSLAS